MDKPLSYISTPLKGNYLYEALPDRLRQLATEDGDREAFVFYDKNWERRSITRQELLDQSVSLAKVLVEQGLRPKANVGFCMSNSLEMLVANMAVVCAGGIPFYMGTNLKDGSDLVEIMKDMNCELLLIDADVGSDNWHILDNVWPLEDSDSKFVSSLKQIICNGNLPRSCKNRINLSLLMRKIPAEGIQLPVIQPEDTIACFCTSGSTGTPKEVVVSHFSIFNWTKQTEDAFELTNDSRFFCDRTFSWVVGYPRTYLVVGATRVLIDPRLSSSEACIENIANVIDKENCDIVYVPNYIAADLFKNPHLSGKFKNVHTFVMSGERYSNTSNAFRRKFCRRVCALYGTTETGGIACFQSDDDNAYEDGIIGKPLGGMEIKLVDSESKTVPWGTRGEICARTTFRCDGYRNNDAIFRAVLDNSNWFHTGDMAHVREDGNLVVDGRNKDLISVQTVKFFPWSIEQTLMKMRGVKHAFAVGVPDKRSFQVICACVVPQEGVVITPDDIRRFCDDVFLDESSAIVVTSKPRYHVILESVPLTRSGKIDRLEIAAIAKVKLNL